MISGNVAGMKETRRACKIFG